MGPGRPPSQPEFRAGWNAMRSGDHAAAAASFAASRRAAGSALAEDATYWEGVALARGGKPAEATTALRRFLSTYPRSARAGEASARLGWLLLDAGKPDAAKPLFEAALADPVAWVGRRAKSGLKKIAAK